MAIHPPGMLSFLYNVMNDHEMNKNFRKNPFIVMEYFQLPDMDRSIIYNMGLPLAALRKERQEETRINMELTRPVRDAEAQELLERNRFQPDMDRILGAVKEELKAGYGRFW